ncbi:hypothetical protein AAFC00_006539 [Neodothiora populina]|uniref:Uncharacterized protein n=1 Tax=Neodothiora populina TaxID=2781224 RepID=A0ABR3PAZ0_9PEZI
MFFTTALISLVAAGASAMPSQMQERAPGGVYFCTGANFTGSCQQQNYALNKCVDFPTGFNKTISSFGPEKGAECLLMQGHCNANEDYYSITYPGVSDLSTISEDNIATSYICLEEFSDAAAKTRVLNTIL